MLIGNLLCLASLSLLGATIWKTGAGRLLSRPCLSTWAGLYSLLFLMVPLALNLLTGPAIGIKGDPIFQESPYIVYGLFQLLTSAAFAVELLAHPPASVRGTAMWPENRDQIQSFVHVGSGLLVPLGLLLFIKGTGMSLPELLVASRFEWFARGTQDSRFLMSGYYMMAMVAVFCFYDFRHRFPFKWLTLVVLIAILGMVFLAGGRKWLLFMLSGAVAGVFDRHGMRFRVRVDWLLGILLMGFLVFFWQYGRHVNWAENPGADQVVADFMEEAPRLAARGDATYFYRASLDAIRLNETEGVIYPGAVLLRVAFLPIPDEWTFGLKPRGLPLLFGEALETGNKTRSGNQPPGLVGLFVLSFGPWLGMLMMSWLLLLWVKLGDRLVLRGRGFWRDAFWASFPISSILLARGSTGGLYFLFFNIFLTIGLATGFRLLAVSLSGFRNSQGNTWASTRSAGLRKEEADGPT